MNEPKSDIKILNQHVRDARYAHSDWQAESWRDCEMFDGDQWSKEDLDKAENAGITPITINRIFPVINLALGHHELNPIDILAKGRTHKDSEIAQVMTEGVRFVFDQNEGQYKISQAFKNQIVAGFGCMEVCLNPDPRQELIRYAMRDWKDILWDPFGDPWFDPTKCRYVIYQPWVDVDDLTALFPSKKREIKDKFGDLTGASTSAILPMSPARKTKRTTTGKTKTRKRRKRSSLRSLGARRLLLRDDSRQ
jgi:hypothetical protein